MRAISQFAVTASVLLKGHPFLSLNCVQTESLLPAFHIRPLRGHLLPGRRYLRPAGAQRRRRCHCEERSDAAISRYNLSKRIAPKVIQRLILTVGFTESLQYNRDLLPGDCHATSWLAMTFSSVVCAAEWGIATAPSGLRNDRGNGLPRRCAPRNDGGGGVCR